MPLYHDTFSSNCATLDVGCKVMFYSGGGVWTEGEDVSGVVGGKFSDGTYCYTVSGGIITSKTSCFVDVTISGLTPTYMINGGGPYIINALSSVAVVTDVSVTVYFVGDLSGFAVGNVIIYTNNTCGADVNVSDVNISNSGENFSSGYISTISPSSSGLQNYITGSVTSGSPSSC